MEVARMTAHPNTALSQHRFQPGVAYRRSAGAVVIECYNDLANSKCSSADLLRIGRDERVTVARRLAAKSLYRALKSGHAKNGRPFASDDLDRVLDRTEGKPVQRVEVERTEAKDPEVLRVELLRILADHPELRDSLGISPAGALGEGVGPPNAASPG